LTYKHPGGLELAIGAFDDRSDLAPQIQVNYAARNAWVTTIFDQPVHEDPNYYMRSRSRSSPSSIPTTIPRSGRNLAEPALNHP
jgi:hypothetical protein